MSSTECNTGDSNRSFVLETYNRLLADVCHIIGVSFSDAPDVSYDWVLNTGPKLDKLLLRWLEDEATFTPTFFRGERDHLLSDSLKYGPLYNSILSCMPDWLSPIWERFLETGSPFVLRHLRTLLLFCYKIEYEPTNEQISEAQSLFEETDACCEVWDSAILNSRPEPHVFTLARKTVASVIYRIDWKTMIGRHGPGGIFPTRLSCDKSRFTTLYQSIIEKFPYDSYYCAMPNYWYDVMVDNRNGPLREATDIVAKLVCVPKDSRGPRLICVHPCEAIWAQLGLAKLLEAHISRSPLLRGKINFTDQTVNANIALLSSNSQRFTTLDLKEASDRISCGLVRRLFGDYTYDILSCCRANKVQLLDGRVIELKKWAPMGNGLTFPVQSLIFWSLVHAGIVTHYGESCSEIYVFGDDIAFPSKYRDGAVSALVHAGLVPNENKTFTAGFFRESCGTDAFKGVSVTPFRMRVRDTSSIPNIISLLDLAKRLRLAGYDNLPTFLYRSIRRALKQMRIGLPISNDLNSPGLFEYRNITFAQLLDLEKSLRFRRDYQTWGSRTCLVQGRTILPKEHDWYHVQDSLLHLARSASGETDRRVEYALPHRVRLSCGWTSCVP